MSRTATDEAIDVKRNPLMLLLAAATAVALAVGHWHDAPAQAPDDGPGWTGATDPAAVIAARQALMLAIEDRMLPIDLYTVDESDDPAVLTANAATIAAMLQATPHLYPPTTNRYDPDADYPETLALPQIWENFGTFSMMADASVAAAEALSSANGPDALREAAVNLRATCDACHALHLRPYVPSQVTEEDLNFDFDSLFDE